MSLPRHIPAPANADTLANEMVDNVVKEVRNELAEEKKLIAELQQLCKEHPEKSDEIATRYRRLHDLLNDADPGAKTCKEGLAATGALSHVMHTIHYLNDDRLDAARFSHKTAEVFFSQLPEDLPITAALAKDLDLNRSSLAERYLEHGLERVDTFNLQLKYERRYRSAHYFSEKAKQANNIDLEFQWAMQYIEAIPQAKRTSEDWERLASCCVTQLRTNSRNALASRGRQAELVRLLGECNKHIPQSRDTLLALCHHRSDLGQYHYERSVKMSKEMKSALRERDEQSAEAQKYKNEGKAMRQAVSERLAKEASEKAEILSKKINLCLTKTTQYLEAILKYDRSQQDWELLAHCYLEQMRNDAPTFFTRSRLDELARLLEECRAHIRVEAKEAKADMRLFIS